MARAERIRQKMIPMIEAAKRMGERNISLWLVGLNPDVLAVVQRASLAETLGRARLHFNLEVAVEAYQARER